jgi:hypothetical protein
MIGTTRQNTKNPRPECLQYFLNRSIIRKKDRSFFMKIKPDDKTGGVVVGLAAKETQLRPGNLVMRTRLCQCFD